MTPIISPWIIYALSLCNGAKGFLIFISIVIPIACFFMRVDGGEFPLKKWGMATLCLMFVIGLLIPSKTTALQMLVAQNVTYERVEIVGETVADVYESIIDAVGGPEE